jgi:putative glutamine amidotransferase
MKKAQTIVPVTLLLSFFLFSCTLMKKEPLKIAVSKASPNYINWLKKMDSTMIPVNMYGLPHDSVGPVLSRCSGLLLTGGEDVQPDLYGEPEKKGLCTEMDPGRDSLETELILESLEMKLPILGICRGEQIINVTLGGTLIVDIPTYFQSGAGSRESAVIHQCEDWVHCFHVVGVQPNSVLRIAVGCDTGTVTTNHHQAVADLAPGLICNARSPDGIIEGIERERPAGKSFLVGVQWHPERMDTANPLSGRLGREFMREARIYSLIKAGVQ